MSLTRTPSLMVALRKAAGQKKQPSGDAQYKRDIEAAMRDFDSTLGKPEERFKAFKALMDLTKLNEDEFEDKDKK